MEELYLGFVKSIRRFKKPDSISHDADNEFRNEFLSDQVFKWYSFMICKKIVTGILVQISPGVEVSYEIGDRKYNEFQSRHSLFPHTGPSGFENRLSNSFSPILDLLSDCLDCKHVEPKLYFDIDLWSIPIDRLEKKKNRFKSRYVSKYRPGRTCNLLSPAAD